jgi:drug/metabolite transporter (DMT)-like permease
MKHRRDVLVALVFVQVFFATLPIAAKIALREFSSPAIALLRVGSGALIFYAIQQFTIHEPIRERAHYYQLALYSVLGVSANQLLYITGLSMTTATAAQMLITGGPAVTLLVAILMGKEAGSRAKWFGIALAGLGALLLVGVASEGGRIYGNVIIVLNMMGYATYLVMARGLLRTYHPLTVITWIFIFGALGLLPFGTLALLRQFPESSLTARLALLWIIIFPTVTAYYINMWALTVVESSVVSTFVYLQPIMTALLAIAILHEQPSARMIPAALLIFAGVAVTIRFGGPKDQRPHPEQQAVVEP